jgi:outer membrane biosynthesis protein TonB
MIARGDHVVRGGCPAGDAAHGPPQSEAVMTPALLIALVLAARSAAPTGPVTAADSIRREVEVRATVLRHAPDVKRCYQDEGLRRNPALKGKIEVELTILPTGTVDSVNVATSLAGPGQHEVSSCVATRARNWRFDRGPYAVETIVFPFVFSPVEREKMDAAGLAVTAAR